jgi:hypothetical protein
MNIFTLILSFAIVQAEIVSNETGLLRYSDRNQPYYLPKYYAFACDEIREMTGDPTYCTF